MLDVMPCDLLTIHWHFRRTCCLSAHMTALSWPRLI